MANNMVRAISRDGGVVICALDSTEIVREAERTHKTSAVATAALGRLLTAASIMGSWLKSEGDSLTLRINGGGPIGNMVCVSDYLSNVRGYVQYPLADVPLRSDGKLDVGAAVGTDGTLAVIKDLGLKEPYIGHVPLVSGEIAEDIASYYGASEQTASICALGVLVNKDLTVNCAGGYIMQLLPGATDEEISRIEDNLEKMPPVTELLAKGKNQFDIVNIMMDGFQPDILDEAYVAYKCYCSNQHTEDILVGLGKDEIISLMKENPVANVECHFCDKEYNIELEKILVELNKKQ